ncbi:NAD(P)-binding protein [Annulohypoxylon maeteangense]|uniref:NAD(P)-binding protein n=1 Tax=Annulohypoxylon maeteangense TaxID=1927788 RepID=UPI0020080CE2|nr:NAD(P)-binding protein [Annulohypoxylon maeteangense]KAI0884738.1 NAD(P)-binding protein [Annulohypoxylon maeteangense]
MDTTTPKPYILPADAVWFITGCSSGIGQALAQHIATKTASQRVVATARNPAALSAATSSIPDSPNVLKTALDVTDPHAIESAFDAALAQFGRVDVVVNNAGYNLMGDAEVSPPGNRGARELMDTNFWGAVDVTKRALSVFRDVNPGTGQIGGVIVNVTSMGGFFGSPGNAYYHASKFALEGFAESVAKEMFPEWGIHVTCVEPGGTRTRYAGENLRRMERHPEYIGEGGATTGMLEFMERRELHGGFASAGEVAEGVYRVVGAGGRIPIRVPLGRDSWGMVMAEVERVKADLEECRDVSCAMGTEDAEEMVRLVK